MAWATVFWENVCREYELVINSDGSSSVNFVLSNETSPSLACRMRQYKLVQGPFPPESVFTGEIGRLKSYEKQKP